MKPLNIYFHIPFCEHKCPYCAFYSVAGKSNLIESYVDALIQEIRARAQFLDDYEMATIYFGGGTPSLLTPTQVQRVVGAVNAMERMKRGMEITLEANPQTVNLEKLKGYRQAGVNRLSLGLQAWQDKLLKKLGRFHDRQTFIEAYQKARQVGFKSINVDLMFGLPTQTLADWRESLKAVIALKPEHISGYSLELDIQSTWGFLASHGKLKPVSETLDRKMYIVMCQKLEQAGYHHYEISNFAKPGYECQHNLDFWQGQDYMGFGAGAFSKVKKRAGLTQSRWVNTSCHLNQ